MNKGSKIVSASIIGADFVNVTVNGKCYTVFSPTVHKLAGAGMYLSDFGNEQDLKSILRGINNSDGDSLFEELSQGTLDELVDAISEAYSLISVESFTKLSTLARNVSSLVAKQK